MSAKNYTRQARVNRSPILNLNILNKFLVVLIALGAIYYVMGVNDLIVKGFELQSLKKTYLSLENRHKDYNSYVTTLKSYNSLASRIEKLDMVQSEQIDYLKSKSGLVAVR